MTENELSKIVVQIAYEIHKQLGPGLFESVYEEIFVHELIENGVDFQRQKGIPVIWKNKKLDLGFRADLIIENKLIIEIKSVETLLPVHNKQLITYLKLTDIKLGLLMNFNANLIKDGISRLVNKL